MIAPLSIVVVDDERLALRRLEVLLGQIPGVEVVGTASTGRAALKLLRDLDPDIVLLDIAMRDMSGLEVAERLREGSRPAIVFVTAYDHHAVEAFERSAIDYLLKPVEVDRLARAIDRARRHGSAEEREAQIAELCALVRRLQNELPAGGIDRPPYETQFWAQRRNELVRIPVDAIVRVAAEGDYVRLHDRDGSGLLLDSISNMTQRLDPEIFIRVHRSTIVRASEVVSVWRTLSGAMVAQLAGGIEVGVGRKYVTNLTAFLSKLGYRQPPRLPRARKKMWAAAKGASPAEGGSPVDDGESLESPDRL